MRKIYWFLLIAGCAVILAASLFLSRNGYKEVAVKKGPVIEAAHALGTVYSRQKYQLKVAVVTSLETLFVKEGDFVKKGEPLAKLENLKVFTAPFSGTVTFIGYDPAEIVSPQTPILELLNLEDKYIEVSLEQTTAMRIKKGQKARVLFESLRAETWEGEVTSKFPKAGEFLAQIDVPKLSDSILPGMTADVAIEVGRREEAILIPMSAVNLGQVLRLRDGKRSKIKVKIGIVDGKWAEVLDGDIKPGDAILIRGKS